MVTVAAMFRLPTSRNWAGNDELIVTVPVEQFVKVRAVLQRLRETPDRWPWRQQAVWGDLDRQIEMAAGVLEISSEIAPNDNLLEALGIID